ncbi:MAG TPA: MFS transporter [bacterium]|nr:MFS transporter [bacterium]
MAAQAPAIGYVSLLRTYPRFRNLWIANIISLLGDWLDAMALAEVAIGLTSRPGSPLTAAQALTAMMLARLLPISLLSPIAGNAADRFPRIKVMQVCNLISAACVLLFLPFLTTEGLPVVLLLLFVKLGALTFFAPAYQAAVPVIVPHEHLQQANALGITTFSAMTALGGSLGGLAVHHLGVQPALVFDAVTFLVANVFLVRVTLPPSPLAETRPQPVKDFMAGLHFLRATPLVLPALLLAPLLDASGSGVIGPLLAEHAWPHRRPDGSLAIGLVSGLIYTAFGLGSVLGPIYVQKLRATPPSMQRIIPGALVVQGISWRYWGWRGRFGSA